MNTYMDSFYYADQQIQYGKNMDTYDHMEVKMRFIINYEDYPCNQLNID